MAPGQIQRRVHVNRRPSTSTESAVWKNMEIKWSVLRRWIHQPPEKGLVKPETVLNNNNNKPDENHNDKDQSGHSHTHRHAECLKPYNPKTARKSTGRAPSIRSSVVSLTRNRIGPLAIQDMYTREESAAAARLFGIPTNGDQEELTDEQLAMMAGMMNDPKVNMAPGLGNGGHSVLGVGPPRPARFSTSWRPGKTGNDVATGDSKSISKEVPVKQWKAVRFSSVMSRGSNTVPSILVTKSVQTVSTAYKFRLNRWPVWGSGVDGGYYRGSSSTSDDTFHYPLWTRRILSFIFSQFGIVLFLTSWITGHAALFQHLEQQPDIKLVNDVVASRNDLVITLATELRQVFPYEMAWRRKIDDYFIKFEATLNNATVRGYSTHRRAFYKWDYFDFLLFSFQLVTGQGYGTDVPKTEWSLLLSIPCVLIGLPIMWLFLIDLGAKWADTLSSVIQQLRWNLARRYPDVVSLHADGGPAPGSSRFLPQTQVNGLEDTTAVRPYQNGGRPISTMMANGDAHDPLSVTQPRDSSPTLRSVWTVEPLTVAMMPAAPAKAAKLTTAPVDETYHHATPWVATVFIVLYPFVGSFIFGLWASLPVTTSFVLPLTSLMLISPPAVFTSFLWRTMFHFYLLIGWVLLIACALLWHQTWRDIIRNWAHDITIRSYQKTYPLQVR